MVRAKNYGRRGNTLFQNACAISYALKHGLEFSVPTKTTNSFWSPLYDQHLVNPKWIEGKEDIVIKEKGMPFQELPFEESWRDKQIVLDGYWQTEKYFKDYRDEILELFNYPYGTLYGIVSVHVRRTDFLELKNKHPEITADWYAAAMEMFPNKEFIFFSDDIDWCRSNFKRRTDCSFERGTIQQDLINASMCEHNICSASTYAWWQMWLNRNPNKKVVFPHKWFVDGWENEDPKDVLPEWVIKL